MILVTGGTGLVGAHLLYRLVLDKEKVRAIYRNKLTLEHVKCVFSCYTPNYEPLLDAIEWVEGDILNIPSLEVALKDISYVYHCAAFVSFDPNKHKISRRTNIEGTANVVNLCIANNIIKLCHVSSIAAVGKPIKSKIVTEATAWNPEDDHSQYAITKYGAELEVWRGTQEGLDAIIVNPGVILGAGIWHKGSGVIFRKVYKGLSYFTLGNVGLVAVKDVVDIMVKLTNSTIKNERYILVAENWTFETLLQKTAIFLGVKPPKTMAKPWYLAIAWRLDWFLQKLFGKRRSLTKHVARALTSKNTYNNTKITSTLNYSFEPVEDTIAKIAKLYLKQTT